MEMGAKTAIAVTVAAVLMFTAGLQIVLASGRTVSEAVFRFSVAGDFGSWTGFEDSLGQLSTTGSDFAIALGDLSYGGESESDWCREFKRSFDNVVLVAGNHDVGLPQDIGGSINEFIKYCPFPLNVPLVGVYGKQYYFDYPRDQPLMRFILISPDLQFVVDDGEHYDYSAGSPRYNWTRDAIDGARQAGIPWVIVAGHENCIAAGEHPCEIGTDIMNLLLDRKVDLILQGHTHHYERSKQLSLRPGSCAGIKLDTFVPGCIAYDGRDGRYVQGQGSVLVIAGIGGRDIDPFNTSDPDAGYIAAWQRGGSPTVGKGVVSLDVGLDRISSQTHVTGNFTDAFTIESSRHPSPLQGFVEILGLTGCVAVGTAVVFVRRIGSGRAAFDRAEPASRDRRRR